MLDHLFTLLSTHGSMDFLLISLSFTAGMSTQWKLPLTVSIFIIRLVKWWMETHPQGQKVARETPAWVEMHRLFGMHLEPKEAQVDNSDKSGS